VEPAEESASDVGGEVLEFTRREEELPAETESASVVSPETEAEPAGVESPEAEAAEFESAEVEEAEEPSAEQPDGDLDLEFDVEEKEEAEDTSATELAEDLLTLDEEEEDLLALDEDEDHSFPNLSEYDSMAEDSELLDDVDEIGTAYIDMGDKEAARSMLDEVKQEGDQAQKEEADELLAQLGG